MSLISKESSFSVSDGFNIHAVGDTDVSLKKSYTNIHHPQNEYKTTNSDTINFIIPATGTKYIDLAETKLYIRFKIVNSKNEDLTYDAAHPNDPEKSDIVSPINNILGSLFSNIDLYLNGVLISNPSINSYAYIDYMKKLLNTSITTKKHTLSASGFYLDNNEPYKNNKSWQTRRGLVKNNSIIEIMGHLSIDFFNQNKYLLNNVEIRLNFNKTANNFFLQTANTSDELFKTKIVDTKLYIKYIEPTDNLLNAHQKMIQNKPAIYPFQRNLLKTYQISAQDQFITLDNLFLSRIPEKIIIAQVATANFIGSQKTNPYNFKPFNIQSLNLYVDNERLPYFDDLDFDNSKYLEAYYLTLNNLGQTETSLEPNGIFRDNYQSGNTIFAFDLTPDHNNNNVDYTLLHRGNVRLEMKYNKANVEPITLLIFYTLPAIIEIDKNREISHDFAD